MLTCQPPIDMTAGSSVTRRQIVDEILEEAESVVYLLTILSVGRAVATRCPKGRRIVATAGPGFREALRQLEADGPSDAESYHAARRAMEAELGRKWFTLGIVETLGSSSAASK